MFKKNYIPVLLGLILAVSSLPAFAAVSSDRIWTETNAADLQRGPENRPTAYRTFTVNRAALLATLDSAPEEFTDASRNSGVVMSLPMPDGTFQRFYIEHSLVVERGLLDKFPELGRTYRGQGIDDPTATARFDFLPSGFHSLILSASGTTIVNPFSQGDTDNYISYYKHNSSQTKEGFSCEVGETMIDKAFAMNKFDDDNFIPAKAAVAAPEVISGTQLRTYRLALAATQEYTTVVSSPNPPTVAAGLAAQVLIMNRVNGVYERDMSIHMNIIANNNLLIYLAEPDPYTNNSPSGLLNENQANLDLVIGTANYDIGHVFSTGGGGVATLNGPCNASTKARGETGLSAPFGDDFAIDFVAHEMGHQFGGRHTFNTSCSGNRSATAAYEPGSGITIMAYAGVCGAQDLAPHSIDTFHVKSLEEIIAYSQTGGGNACAVTTATGNTPPSITSPASFTVPKLTPFTLTATASDSNGDIVTYDWQEYDLGAATSAIPNTDSAGALPIFRPYSPTASGSRTFPSLQYILNNANVPPSTYGAGFLTGELMPQAGGRTMTFQAIARDNRANGGGINTSTTTVVVDSASGPFAVTAPNTNVTYAGGSSQTVTWNVNNTTAAPVSAANVKISYSTDGGSTFPTTLLASTPNDGTQAVTIPVGNTTTTRIKVEAVGNVFFDISDANFTVNGLVVPPTARADFDGDGKTDQAVFRPTDGNWYINRSTAGFQAFPWGLGTDVLTPGDYDGDQKTDAAVYRETAFYVLNSNGNVFVAYTFGQAGDIAVSADYDGDQKTDCALFRPSDNTWRYVPSSGGGNVSFVWGQAGDVPVVGDFSGDGRADYTVFRSGTSWFSKPSNGAPSSFTPLGVAGDLPIPADYNGDNIDDYAVYRPSDGNWYIIDFVAMQLVTIHWGQAGGSDVPIPGDYDGDNKDDQAVYRPSEGNWYMNGSTSGFTAIHWGQAGGVDKPIPRSYQP